MKLFSIWDFNFNSGQFVCDGVEYIIVEIGNNAFKCDYNDWYFKNCNLTIPSTIKKIDDRAFFVILLIIHLLIKKLLILILKKELNT